MARVDSDTERLQARDALLFAQADRLTKATSALESAMRAFRNLEYGLTALTRSGDRRPEFYLKWAAYAKEGEAAIAKALADIDGEEVEDA